MGQVPGAMPQSVEPPAPEAPPDPVAGLSTQPMVTVEPPITLSMVASIGSPTASESPSVHWPPAQRDGTDNPFWVEPKEPQVSLEDIKGAMANIAQELKSTVTQQLIEVRTVLEEDAHQIEYLKAASVAASSERRTHSLRHSTTSEQVFTGHVNEPVSPGLTIQYKSPGRSPIVPPQDLLVAAPAPAYNLNAQDSFDEGLVTQLVTLQMPPESATPGLARIATKRRRRW